MDLLLLQEGKTELGVNENLFESPLQYLEFLGLKLFAPAGIGAA